ncbi:energy transducer TonB [Terracidiphilus sp.]|jgi:TonB family protein|uniref:energy transducer TonB n=1 Tax=Terracidiphilus sp. TaxID=1964191 RepID=UPI003C1D36D5
MFLCALASLPLYAQEVQPAPTVPPPAAAPAPTATQAPSLQQGAPAPTHDEPPITEDQLRQQLQGKTFYLRSGYLENTLHFTSDGKLDGSSSQASYTLSLVQIESVHLEKHKLVLEGTRYGLHFLGALATEDQSAALDKVRLTTKKKPLRIEVDREEVDTSFEKKKEKQEAKEDAKAPHTTTATAPAPTSLPASPAPESIPQTAQQAQPTTELNRRGAAVTTSTTHANAALHKALDGILSPGIDDRMIASLPAYWQLYYQAVAAKADYRPADPSILRQSQVDQKAHLLQAFEPPSNEYAQSNGIVGIAMYHVVVGADGKPTEIAIGRPIGFGLDENAVESIRKASFQPALKQGQPVPVLVDLTVQFRIYSKLTSTPAAPPTTQADAPKPQTPVLPGPYSANTKPQ